MTVGNRNTGNLNTGNRNTGDRNTGNRNTGDWNTGNLNTGNRNTGDWNTGDWNTGNRNTGFFCVETPQLMFFDKPWDGTWDEASALIPFVELPIGVSWVSTNAMTKEEKVEFPNHITIGGYLKTHTKPIREVFPDVWARMDQATRGMFLALPNFDAEKFFQITGVDVRRPDPAEEIEVNGVKYRMVH